MGQKVLPDKSSMKSKIWRFCKRRVNKVKNYYVCYLPWMCTLVVCINEKHALLGKP